MGLADLKRRYAPRDAFHLSGQRWMKRFVPARIAGDLVGKPWMEGAVPVLSALLIAAAIAVITPNFGSVSDVDLMSIFVTELGFLVVALTIVLVAGGIDLSVGAVMGVSAMSSITMFRVYEMPTALIVPAAILIGVALGAVNGFFVGVLQTRPFITTLVTALIFRALISVIQSEYTNELVQPRENLSWLMLGQGRLLGVRFATVLFIVVLIVSHIALTRSRWGWWVTAVGSDRRSARRNGINPGRVTVAVYMLSGGLSALAGLLYAARQGNTSNQISVGYEIAALTAVVLGGVSLKGGRGSVIRATLGLVVVALIGQFVIRRALTGNWNTLLLAAALLLVAVADIKWGKYRLLIARRLISVRQDKDVPGPLVDLSKQGPWRVNSVLASAEPIALGELDGAEDLAVHTNGDIFCGDRRGWIWRIPEGDGSRAEIFARTGGLPLGHAWYPDGSLMVAVGGVGLCQIGMDRSVQVLAGRTSRNPFRLVDDSSIRFADDLDVTPDGSIYISDIAVRRDAANYDAELENRRAEGRVLRYDPRTRICETVFKNYPSPNGITTAHDGQSILINSTMYFRIDRLWIAGPKQGRLEPFVVDLPGYPDNINRASDGNYWVAFFAMRTPVSDLFIKHPRVRHRMTREMPMDDWITPQANVSCVAKFDENGNLLSTRWDESMERHPMVTSMKEHEGQLYLAGLLNNRIGRLELPSHEVGAIDAQAVPGLSRSERTPVG